MSAEGMIEGIIGYEEILSEVARGGLEEIRQFLSEELPHQWADKYRQVTPHRANILRIEIRGFEYLFDFSSELVKQGVLTNDKAVEDRLVAVHGRSQSGRRKRENSRQRKRPVGPIEYLDPHRKVCYDRGHFIGHALGGGLDINIFPQPTATNRGKLFRSMERYCQYNPGTYCFSRPIYSGYLSHPSVIEFGVLKADKTLWTNSFPNCGDPNEMAEIEWMLREKLAGRY